MILRLIGWGFGLCIAGALILAFFVWLYIEQMRDELPDYTALRSYKPKVMTRVHAGNGSLIAEYATERRIFVPIEAIPDSVVHAFISAEDKTFFEHGGLDYRGIFARAIVGNVLNYIQGRRLVGASTITQQVAKNFLVGGERSVDRKVKEAMIALRMEEAFTKEQILELYLNEIYLGWRSYGIAAAALNYFDKSLDELTYSEAAYLAAMPKGPENYRPDRAGPRQRGIDRRNWVLERMAANGYITPTDAEKARSEPLNVYPPRPAGAQMVSTQYFAEEVRRRVMDRYGPEELERGGLSIRTTLEPRLQSAALKALRTGLIEYDRRHGWRGPVTKLPSFDNWPAQLAKVKVPGDLAPWEKAVVVKIDDAKGRAQIGLGPAKGRVVRPDQKQTREGFIALDELKWARPALAKGRVGPEIERPSQVLSVGDVILVQAIKAKDGRYGLRQIPAANGGIVALDPHTGRVLAMIGGFSFRASEFNRVNQAKRQPGSSFKPFVFVAAFDNNYTPSSIQYDSPFPLNQGPSLPTWKPKNYTSRFEGKMTLRRGMEKSSNLIAIRLAYDIGLDKVMDYGRRFGVLNNRRHNYSVVLGSHETTLLEMTVAYGMFVNGGKRIEPIFIDRIQDRLGQNIYRKDERECPDCMADEWTNQFEPRLADLREQILDPHTAYQIVSLLEGVVQRGTGKTVRSVGKPLAGKTGTTNDFLDAWFVGFAPDLAVGVYVGFDTPQTMGRAEGGGRVAAPIFREFMKVALEDQKPVPFRIPSGIKLVRVLHKTGQRATANAYGDVILEAFKPGTGPEQSSGRRRLPRPGQSGSGVQRGSGGLY